VTVYETDVPGVGRKFEVKGGDGARAAVLLYHDGRVAVFNRPHPDADSEKVFDLTSQQADYLGSILEAHFETVNMDQLSVPLATVGTPLVVGYLLAMSIFGTILMRLSGRVERLVARVRGSESTAPAA
jgi:hypothetical protein